MAEEQRRLELLVVEDEPGVRDLLVNILSFGFPYLNIQTAKDGQDAYDKITTKRPDIIYTDITMPRMSGDELLEKLLEEIKLDSTKKYIPTIVMSGRDFGTEKGKKAVESAIQMYSEDQLKLIKSYTPPVGLNEKPFVPYEGFTSLPKPFDAYDVIERTRLLLNSIQGVQPQS